MLFSVFHPVTLPSDIHRSTVVQDPVKKAEEYIGKLTKEADKLATHAGRKTLKAEDIEMAAKN